MVQGVGFRYNTVRRARAIGLSGWVRNETDGSVLVHIQGSQTEVEEMLRWLERGPAYARVDSLVTSPAAYDPSLFDFQVAF
jgi:acylphosphatase